MSHSSLYGYLFVFAAAQSGLLFGYEVGVISQVLEMDGFKLQFGALQRGFNATLIDGPAKSSLPALTTFAFLVGRHVAALIPPCLPRLTCLP
jgi:hypothetical protein